MTPPPLEPPHLAGRQRALEPLGWRGRHAAWLTLVCLHSGVFLRSQYRAYHRCSEPTARRFVDRVLAAGVGREHPISPDLGAASEHLCHLYARPLYRALGIEHVRHRRTQSPGLLFRRLLSLDYVIDHPALPWLPTETEKVAHFTGGDIPLTDLPRRTYKGAVAPTVRYFPIKLPVAADETSTTFVYTVTGSGDLHSLDYWGEIHEPLWAGLRQLGRAVHVAAVTRTNGQARSAGAKLAAWCGEPPPPAALSSTERDLMEDVALLQKTRDTRLLDKWGGVEAAAAAVERIQRRNTRNAPARPAISTSSTHVAARLRPDSLTLP